MPQNNNINPPPFWARGLSSKNRKIVLTIVIILLIAGAVALFSKNKTGEPEIKSETELQSLKTETVTTEKEKPYPVSLPALMQKQFDGRDLKLGKVLEENSAYTRYYITYKSGELTISGIMNVPKTDSGQNGFPVLILNHGHIDTSIYTNGRGLRREQDYLARQGFVVIHPDYRNHAESDDDPDAETSLRLGYAEDVINAIYAVKNSELPYFNKNSIGMLGHSMGGGVSINVSVIQPDLVKAFVLYAPVSSDYKDNFDRWTKTRKEVADKVIELHGSYESNPQFWQNISAVNFLDRVKAPILIFHGTSDDSVPYEWSQTLEKKLTEQGKEVTLVTYSPEEHEFGPKWTDFMQQSTSFFNKYLK